MFFIHCCFFCQNNLLIGTLIILLGILVLLNNLESIIGFVNDLVVKLHSDKFVAKIFVIALSNCNFYHPCLHMNWSINRKTTIEISVKVFARFFLEETPYLAISIGFKFGCVPSLDARDPFGVWISSQHCFYCSLCFFLLSRLACPQLNCCHRQKWASSPCDLQFWNLFKNYSQYYVHDWCLMGSTDQADPNCFYFPMC